jgi:hypothetical protein
VTATPHVNRSFMRSAASGCASGMTCPYVFIVTAIVERPIVSITVMCWHERHESGKSSGSTSFVGALPPTAAFRVIIQPGEVG